MALNTATRVYNAVLAFAKMVALVGLSVQFVALTALLLMPQERGRSLLLWLTQQEARPAHVEKVVYGVKCDLSDPAHIIENLDTYFLEHLVGWVFGALVVRSAGVSFMHSFSWEMVEWLFQYVFRVFQECWWDKVLLDGMLGNGVGMLVGSWLARKVGLRKFQWYTRDYVARSFVFQTMNYILFAFGAMTIYAFNDVMDIPDFHPLTFYFMFGSIMSVIVAQQEHYDHFSNQRVTFRWRILCVTTLSLMFLTAWQYGLKNKDWRLPENWQPVMAAVVAFYVLAFFVNLWLRKLPTLAQLEKEERENAQPVRGKAKGKRD